MNTTRRNFIKTVGIAAAATSVVAGAALADEPGRNGVPHTWEIVPEPIADEQIVETVDADAVIVGAGISGVAAFMYAAEGGAKTVLVEKGTSYNGRGLDFSAIGTKVQAENGIVLDKGQIINDLIKSSGYKANGSLIRLWTDHSGWVFDRLIDMTRADGGDVVLGEGSKALADGTDFWCLVIIGRVDKALPTAAAP